MHCAHCSEKIKGRPFIEGNDNFCSLECANAASGIAPEEVEEYFEENDLDEYFTEEE
jgi:hypothetical protein